MNYLIRKITIFFVAVLIAQGVVAGGGSGLDLHRRESRPSQSLAVVVRPLPEEPKINQVISIRRSGTLNYQTVFVTNACPSMYFTICPHLAHGDFGPRQYLCSGAFSYGTIVKERNGFKIGDLVSSIIQERGLQRGEVVLLYSNNTALINWKREQSEPNDFETVLLSTLFNHTNKPIPE